MPSVTLMAVAPLTTPLNVQIPSSCLVIVWKFAIGLENVPLPDPLKLIVFVPVPAVRFPVSDEPV